MDSDPGDRRRIEPAPNPGTRRPVVTPMKPATSAFQPVPPLEPEGPAAGASFDATLRHVEQITGFRPYKLPSGGYLYPKDSPLSSGEVLVRAMRTDEEEMLLHPDLVGRSDLIERILKQCVRTSRDEELKDTLQLLSQDRAAILVFIRVTTMGPLYEAEMNCPRCGHVFQVRVDLEKDLDLVACSDPSIREPFVDVLPQTRLIFEYRLPRGYDDLAVIQHVEQREKKRGLKAREDALFIKVCRLVTAIRGCATDGERERLLRHLGTMDLIHIRWRLDFPPFGVNTAMTVACPKCEFESKTRLPMPYSFFVPWLEAVQAEKKTTPSDSSETKDPIAPVHGTKRESREA
jgi:hypothetical protein